MRFISFVSLFSLLLSGVAFANKSLPKKVTLRLSAAEARKLDGKNVKLAKSPTRPKVKAVAAEWTSYETPNFVHPPAFTYAVKGELAPAVTNALVSAVLADEFVMKRAIRYEADLEILPTQEQLLKATQTFFNNAGFGKFEESGLKTKMAETFASKPTLTFYGGSVTAVLDKKISYGADIVIIVDDKVNEITGLGHGDLLSAFEESTDEN